MPGMIMRTFQVIDGKAAALLGHTSMMVDALGVTGAVVADSHAQEAVIVVEIVFYSRFRSLCLRCIWLFHEASDAAEARLEDARDEFILRRGLFTLCNRATMYLTVDVRCVPPRRHP